MKKNVLLIVSGISLSSFFFEFLRYANRPGRGLGRCDGRHYRRSSDWAGSLCGNWRGRRGRRRRFNRKNYPGESSCTIWSAAVRWLPYCAMGWAARLFLQPLYRSGL